MDPQQAPGRLRVATQERAVPQDADRERSEWAARGEAPHHCESPTLDGAHDRGPAPPAPTLPCHTSTSESGSPAASAGAPTRAAGHCQV